MSLIVATIILQLLTSTLSTNTTEDAATNKSKRAVASQNFAESRPVVLYADNPGSQTNFYSPATVPSQQVHYEFQQTPTSTVPNQYYQPESSNNQHSYSAQHFQHQQNGAAPHFITPVQHSHLIRHGQVQFQPQHIQTHQYVPGRFLYVNGKIIYQPHQFNQNHYQRPQNYVNYQSLPQKVVPQQPVRPMAYQKFQPPQAHHYQKITKPVEALDVVEEQNEEEGAEDEDAPVKEREESEESDNASHEEADDGDEDRYFGKYSSFHDDDDHGRYMDEDEEDSDRGSSKSIPKKYHSKLPKYSNNYKFGESYTTSSKYEKPPKKAKNGNSPSKMHYKSVKYSEQSAGKPRSERYEGKQSRNVPVVHRQKIFKEKWYVTKSTDDSRK